MKQFLSLLLSVALLCFLCVTNPTTDEFADWYADQSLDDMSASVSGQISDAYAQFLALDTQRSDYLFCSVFTYHGNKTLGIGLMFFPVDSLQEQLGALRSGYASWLEHHLG